MRTARHADAIIAMGDDVGLLIAAMKVALRSRTPLIMICNHMRSRKARLLFGRLGLQRRSNGSCPARPGCATLLAGEYGIAAEDMDILYNTVDHRFFTVDTDRESPRQIASAGLTLRDYKTLMDATRGLDADVKIEANSAWYDLPVNFTAADVHERVELCNDGTTAGLRAIYAESAIVAVPLVEVGEPAGNTTVLEGMAMGKLSSPPTSRWGATTSAPARPASSSLRRIPPRSVPAWPTSSTTKHCVGGWVPRPGRPWKRSSLGITSPGPSSPASTRSRPDGVETMQSERVVVIGSGPAGAMAARELVRRGLPVTMLESGTASPRGLLVRAGGRNVFRWGVEAEAHDDDYVATGNPSTDWCYHLAPGGLTNQWTGAVPRFAPQDFHEGERLDERYVWPVTYDELAPFYDDAESVLQITGGAQDVSGLPGGHVDHTRRLPADWQAVKQVAAAAGRGSPRCRTPTALAG